MTLLMIAVVWIILILLVVALCAVARVGDRDLTSASRTSTPMRLGRRALHADPTETASEQARRKQGIAA